MEVGEPGPFGGSRFEERFVENKGLVGFEW
jgi:hypothetical protein